jgi:hypothetical protein
MAKSQKTEAIQEKKAKHMLSRGAMVWINTSRAGLNSKV